MRMWAASVLLLLAACSSPQGPIYESLDTSVYPPAPELDPTLITRGADLYAMHCAICHRPDLSGNPEWRTPDADGGYRPPPHDSSGHTWHHSDAVLIEIILNGYDLPIAESRMPVFGGLLTMDEVLAILEFFKASWGPDERQHQWEQTLRDAD